MFKALNVVLLLSSLQIFVEVCISICKNYFLCTNEFNQYFPFFINQDIPSVVTFDFLCHIFVGCVNNKYTSLIASHKDTYDK